MHQCDLKNNQNLMIEFEKEYSKMDVQLLNLKLSKPALRALLRLGIYSLDDLSRFNVNELKIAHGIGPTTLVKILPYLKQ